MLLAHLLPRHWLSLLVLLCLIARGEAQSIPLPLETPRAGTYTTPAVKARANKTTWRPKGSVVPAQAEEEAVRSEPSPTPAPPLEEPAADVQYLRAPANATESAPEEMGSMSPTQPVQTQPPRANPLRQASRSQAYAQHARINARHTSACRIRSMWKSTPNRCHARHRRASSKKFNVISIRGSSRRKPMTALESFKSQNPIVNMRTTSTPTNKFRAKNSTVCRACSRPTAMAVSPAAASR